MEKKGRPLETIFKELTNQETLQESGDDEQSSSSQATDAKKQTIENQSEIGKTPKVNEKKSSISKHRIQLG